MSAPIITVYGRSYGPNDHSVIDSLFTAGGTLHGTYKRHKHGLVLIDLQGVQRVLLGRTGPHTIHTHETGRRIMAGCTPTDETWCNVPNSYMEQVEQAEAALRSIGKVSA